jgi:hypothetical protein
MDLNAILKQLRDEHAKLTESILALERLAAENTRRRGRPPAWLLAAKTAVEPKRRGRPPGSKKAAKSGGE